MPTPPRNVAVILPAAGSGRRFGGAQNKLFARILGEPIWLLSATRLCQHPRVARVVMPVSSEDRPIFDSEFAAEVKRLAIDIVDGGAERTESVQSGVQRVADDPTVELIAIHDAARPLVQSEDLDRVFAKADETGAAILATPVTATVKQSNDSGASCRTVDRSTLWLAQTPQVFRKDLLQTAYEKHRGRPATDDAELVQRIGVNVAIVSGSPENLKITHAGDLIVAEAILKSRTESKDA